MEGEWNVVKEWEYGDMKVEWQLFKSCGEVFLDKVYSVRLLDGGKRKESEW